MLQLPKNPLIDKALRACGRSRHILALGVHQHKPSGVPELIAKVSISFATLEVEVDIAAERGVCCHGEAQRISPKRWNAFRELLARRLLDRARLFRIHEAKRSFGDEAF